MSQENAVIEVRPFVDALKSLMSEYQQAWSDPLGASASPVLCLYDVCLLAGLSEGEMITIFGKRLFAKITKLVETPLDVEVKQLDLPLELAGAAD
jgi:hypothetical protein